MYWNSSAERLFGYASAGAIGSSIDVLIVSPGQREDLAGLARRRKAGSLRAVVEKAESSGQS